MQTKVKTYRPNGQDQPDNDLSGVDLSQQHCASLKYWKALICSGSQEERGARASCFLFLHITPLRELGGSRDASLQGIKVHQRLKPRASVRWRCSNLEDAPCNSVPGSLWHSMEISLAQINMESGPELLEIWVTYRKVADVRNQEQRQA